MYIRNGSKLRRRELLQYASSLLCLPGAAIHMTGIRKMPALHIENDFIGCGQPARRITPLRV
jgi:hypothetical protein